MNKLHRNRHGHREQTAVASGGWCGKREGTEKCRLRLESAHREGRSSTGNTANTVTITMVPRGPGVPGNHSVGYISA